MSEVFGPNEERYKKISTPHENEEVAIAAIGAFFHDMNALREKHQIPEIVVVVAAYHGDPEARKTVANAANFGNLAYAPELAAAAYMHYVVPILERARALEKDSAPAKKR